MEIRVLRPGDDRAAFHSGDQSLDRFFHQFAGQNQFRHHIGTTYVAVDGGRVIGFVTVAPGEIEFETIPAALRKKLPQYPLPILRIARLAADESVQGQGVGGALLRYALELAIRLSGDFGCVGVVVDAKPGAETFYAKYGFVAFEALEGESAARPMPTAMFLPMRAIKAARGA